MNNIQVPTILEAIQALQAEECEAIESCEGARFSVEVLGDKIPLMVTVTELSGPWNLINPKPQFDEVEVVRWECLSCGEIHKFFPTSCKGTNEGDICNAKNFFELKGTRLVPRKRKVVREKIIGTRNTPIGLDDIPDNATIIARWEE